MLAIAWIFSFHFVPLLLVSRSATRGYLCKPSNASWPRRWTQIRCEKRRERDNRNREAKKNMCPWVRVFRELHSVPTEAYSLDSYRRTNGKREEEGERVDLNEITLLKICDSVSGFSGQPSNYRLEQRTTTLKNVISLGKSFVIIYYCTEWRQFKIQFPKNTQNKATRKLEYFFFLVSSCFFMFFLWSIWLNDFTVQRMLCPQTNTLYRVKTINFQT